MGNFTPAVIQKKRETKETFETLLGLTGTQVP